MFLLYSLRPGAPIWPIGVGGPRVRPVRAHSSYATEEIMTVKEILHELAITIYKARQLDSVAQLVRERCST